MNRLITSIVLILIAPLFLVGVEAFAVEKKRTFGLRKEGESHVQLRSMMAPVQKSAKSKRPKDSPVTVIMTVADGKRVGKVCNKAPRINDALVGAWYKKPILKSYLYDRKKHKGKTNINYKRTKAQKKEDVRLLKIINKAIGRKEITQIMVVNGVIRMGGGAVTKLPFSSKNGCDELE
jgi:hypothetical protein